MLPVSKQTTVHSPVGKITEFANKIAARAKI